MTTRANVSAAGNGGGSTRGAAARRAGRSSPASPRGGRGADWHARLHIAPSMPASADVAVACAQVLRAGGLADRAIRARAESWLRAHVDSSLVVALGELASKRARELESLLDGPGALDAAALGLRDEAEAALVALGIAGSASDAAWAEERRVLALLARLDAKAEARDLATAGTVDRWVIALAASEADTWWLRAALGSRRLAS